MKIQIRKGVQTDLPQVLDLIKELAIYEDALDEVTIKLEDLERDGFGSERLFHFLVAVNEKELVGIAFYYTRYSTWKGKILYLEDFVVKEQDRGNGIGTLLFEETLRVCKNKEYNGMAWQVLDWNEPAINFYKKYKASLSSSWLNCKLSKNQIKSLIP
ncbi:MAG: GNAT family N-acetyltransferase [Flavobacteriales bacterium]|jgi:GNAT superfamily N-acetyltransferase|tara:strand:- start:5363 stop:5836 length:474 start_codon:yes stop_codon:yes gene_type:complete